MHPEIFKNGAVAHMLFVYFSTQHYFIWMARSHIMVLFIRNIISYYVDVPWFLLSSPSDVWYLLILVLVFPSCKYWGICRKGHSRYGNCWASAVYVPHVASDAVADDTEMHETSAGGDGGMRDTFCLLWSRKASWKSGIWFWVMKNEQ